MRKRVKIALAVLVVLLLAVFGWELSRRREPEPVYQGKPLSYWLTNEFRPFEAMRMAERWPG